MKKEEISKKVQRVRRYVERDGKIYARVSYTDGAGKRRQIWRRAASKSDAQAIARELERELTEKGTEAFEHRLTVDAYLTRWLGGVRQQVSIRTHGQYEDILRLYVRPYLGKLKLIKVRPLDVQEMVNQLGARKLSPRTIHYAHMVLSCALKQATRWRLLGTQPAAHVQLPKQVRREMRVLCPDEAKQFLAAAATDRYGLLFEFAIVTGMRPEEYLALRWEDLDFARRTVIVRRTLIFHKKGGGWYFGEPKTAHSRRLLPLPAYLMPKLQAWRIEQAKERLRLGPKYQNNELVFCGKSGKPLRILDLDLRHFKPALVRAHLPKIRLYDLRHTCATLLLLAGENPKVVSERLGHSTIVLTLDIYSHVLPSMQEAATERLAQLLAQ
jgi:integrase